jgi:NADH-quinone oxidoreductase subunit M
VLAAGYLLWMYQRVAMGTPKPEFEHEHIHDVHGPEWIAWTPLILGIVVFGLFPNLIFSITDGAAQHLTKAFG